LGRANDRMSDSSATIELVKSIEMRHTTPFKRQFKAFLAVIGFQLKHFAPDDYFGADMFPDCRIPRATVYEKLRGQGGFSEQLALLWARRSGLFLAKGLEVAKKERRKLSFDGISFIDCEDGEPRVSWRKLISLYEPQELVPLSIRIDGSIDDAKVLAMLDAVRGVVGNIKVKVVRVKESSIEVTALVAPQEAAEIIARFVRSKPTDAVVEVKETVIPTKGSIARHLLLDGPIIDLGQSDALERFGRVWQRAIRIESAIRPWRRLRWLASPSVRSSPICRVIQDSNDRAYAADLRGKWRALKADLQMTCITWPLSAALTLALILSVLHSFFPFVAVSAGVTTGLALSLVGVQVCASALSPIACGAGTIVMCWAFGLAQAFAIGAFQGGESLSRSAIQSDFFISLTGGIVGLSAPDWLSRIRLPMVILFLIAIPSAIFATGWFMAQPTKAAGLPRRSRRRLILGAMAGSGMGAGIGLVRLTSAGLVHFGCPQHIAVIAAFMLLGSATFASTIRLRMPQLQKFKLVLFALSYALIACMLCGLAYRNAGGGLGLTALAASTGWYHATWFTAASVVGDRIGSARAAVIATTIEGAVGFTAFVVFRLLQA